MRVITAIVSGNGAARTVGRAGLLLGLATASLLCAACGSDSGRQPVYPVQGRVLFNGKPVSRALVVFHAEGEEAKKAPRPHAQTRADGSFVLTTYAGEDGAPAGNYVVTVECWETNLSRKAREGESDPPVNYLPGPYCRPQTSGLRTQVRQQPNQLPAFRLTSR